MKKYRVFIAITIAIILCTSCEEQKVIQATPEKVQLPQQEESKNLTILTPNLLGLVGWKSMTDSVVVMISAPVKLEKKNTTQTVAIKDGAITIVDNINNLLKTVPYLTEGKVLEIKTSSSGKNFFVVSFSRNDATYTFEFWENGSKYLLSSKAKLVYQGVEYLVTPVITSNSECFLYVSLRSQQVINEVKEQAEGRKPN